MQELVLDFTTLRTTKRIALANKYGEIRPLPNQKADLDSQTDKNPVCWVL